MKKLKKGLLLGMVLVFALSAGMVYAGSEGGKEVEINEEAISKWIEEFQPSVLTPEEQREELEWFARAAAPYKGLEIKSVAEGIKTHYYESEVLAKAFSEITGINVTHDVLGEGEIVQRVQKQIQTGRKIYDIYVNDTDLIGMHYRAQSALNYTDYMDGEGAHITNPNMDWDDFLNLEFGQDYDGNQLQIPDQQFAILYWFRHDWFTRPELKKAFKQDFGYELGVPINWAAYEDIAKFFTGRNIDGRSVYGHMDYGKKSPSLGWRISDAFLAVGGMGDKGLPNGMPVDDWGIRVENGIPVGASVERGGAVNGPAAVYAITKYVDFMKKYADPVALDMTWSEEGPYPGQGHIAQSWYMCCTWLSEDAFADPSSPVVDNETGMPLWRVAPQPHGKYWEEGQKVGYQDAGAWTILKDSVDDKHRDAAWLWAQFCISKTVDLKKFTVGRTPIRKSTIWSDHIESTKEQYGGMVEFYRSNQEKLYTPTGMNVPHYPALAEKWWQNVAQIIIGEVTPQEGMDNLARDMDDIMGKLNMKFKSPELNPVEPRENWLKKPGAPKDYIEGEEQGIAIPYEEALEQWLD
jgi:glycerol transport system substrate-binding protein